MKNVPNLRFKEFSGEWKQHALGDVFDFYTTNSFSRDFLDNDKGRVKNIHYGDIHMKFPTLLDVKNTQIPYVKEAVDLSKISIESYCKNGDVVIADASEDYNDIGKAIELKSIGEEKIIAGLHTILARDNKGIMVNGFKGYLMNSPSVRKQIKVYAAGAKVLGISKTNISKVKLLIPSGMEQEKIAAFFYLIDKKIALQTEKVEELKNYKKGLLQKIFSQELGFKDDNGNEYPEWEEKKLGDISECLDHRRKPLNSNEREEIQGDIPYYGANGVVDYVNDYIFNEDIILLAEDGGNFDDFATRPIAQLIKGKSWVNKHAHVLKAKIDNDFLFYSLVHKDIRKYINGTSRSKLNKSDMLDILIKVPNSTEEQKKISAFLGEIYSRINKEQEKLDFLNRYKKGLLQQMFI